MKTLRPAFLIALLTAFALGSSLATADDVRIEPPVSTNTVGTTVQLLLFPPDGQQTAYQWSKDGVALADDDRIFGSQTPILIIGNAQLNDTGVYSLTFSNSVVVNVDTNSTATNITQVTASATVYVFTGPEIQSVNTETRGVDVLFRANATGGLLSYQWMWQGQDLPGATTSVLSFTNAYANANAGYYQVRVSNPANLQGITSSFDGLLFTKPTPSGTYVGLFYVPDATTLDSSGSFQYTVSASRRSFSGKLLIGPAAYRFSGAFSPDHHVLLSVPGPNNAPLTMDLQLLTTNETPQVVGSIGNANWTALFCGNRLHFSSKILTPLAGKYTLSFQNTNASSGVPNGDGYATVVIKSNGTMTLSGQVASGTSISQSSGLSRLGDWPLYITLNKGRGRLLGWLKVKQGSPSIQGTNVFWLKAPGPDKLYPGDYSLNLQAKGSLYVPPTTGPILNFTNGVAALYAGDLFSDSQAVWDFVKVILRKPTSFVAEDGAEGLSLSVNRGNGVVSGSFINLMTGRRSSIKGVVLQQQSCARGFFLSTNAAGAFILVPGNVPK